MGSATLQLLCAAPIDADPALAARRADALRRLLGVSTLVLLAATWRLWTPQCVFPRVPLVLAAAWVPSAVEWLLAGLCVAALATCVVAPAAGRVGPAALRVFAGAMAGLMLCDQHRLQPWAYQALLISLALANLPPNRALPLVRLLTASIYFYSGLSKLDYEFLHTLGQQFLGVLAMLGGIDSGHWPAGARLAGAALFPVGELTIALGLCFRRTQRAALWASLALHAALIVVLGPWGLRHSAGVLLWNVYFMAQNLLLFGPPPLWRTRGRLTAETQRRKEEEGEGEGEDERPERNELATVASEGSRWLTRRGYFTSALFVVALLLPVGEPWGLCDTWLGWSLYSPGTARVLVFVHRRAVGRLGPLEDFLGEADEADRWVQVAIDRWSIAALGAPVYPQNRFQLGVGEAIGNAYHLDHWIQAVEFSRANRWTGRREVRKLSGQTEIADAARAYLFNAQPDGWRP